MTIKNIRLNNFKDFSLSKNFFIICPKIPNIANVKNTVAVITNIIIRLDFKVTLLRSIN